MDYEGQICRGPLEKGAFMLPVTVGCPYNRCVFCDLFKHIKYREIEINDIEKELKRVHKLNGNPNRIFLGDGSAFSLSTNRLVEILHLINKYFKGDKIINCDATITSIKNKSDKDLILLKKLGINTLYIGIESGLDDVLKFMNKDHDISEALVQIERLKKAGIDYAAHIMTGVSGKERGIENAIALGDFLNKTNPSAIVNFSMFLSSKDLLNKINKKEFICASEYENLVEEKELIKALNFKSSNNITYNGFHDWIHLQFKGKLPRDKDKIIASIDKAIKDSDEYREIYSSNEIMQKMGKNYLDYGFNNREYASLIDVYEKGIE